MASLGVHGLLALLGLWLCTKLFLRFWRRGASTTRLSGSPSPSRFLGVMRHLSLAADSSEIYEEWAARYGPAYEIPAELGRRKIILTDPKAVTHFYSSERSIYVRPENDRLFVDKIFGRGVLWAEGDTHKRQRKALTPAFSNAAIRRLTALFYDSTYKMKSRWDAILDSVPSHDGAVIEVQECLDSIGVAGFSHDFRYIDGQKSAVTAAFEALQVIETSLFSTIIFILSFTFPILLSVPTERMRLFWALRASLDVIAQRLLANTRREKEAGAAEELMDKSVIGLLLKAEMSGTELHMTQEEVTAQVPIGLLISVSLTVRSRALNIANLRCFDKWALVELARHPDKLRKDLMSRFSTDPTWDQLYSELPYLDATVLKVLRLHPPIGETLREVSSSIHPWHTHYQFRLQAAHDDIIPLGTPIVTPSGETISSIVIGKGTSVVAPIRFMNRSEALWGPDAKEFKPERWFADITTQAKELQGHRHLLTFHDGPRTCLGNAFALAEFKAALSVLIRNFVLEFPDVPDTKIEKHVSIVPRPKVAGQNGAKVPLKVTRVE
ncbi:cytochrome P450 [Mycena metata]|uniref:Cytochrome P450 n=1 Tax=Mycena metata TaxID=1033252 RepID=A0AAD7H5V6_9AGAR|nr:cytochrome P450 [Mycena metata]